MAMASPSAASEPDAQHLRSLLLSSTPDRIPSACRAVESLLLRHSSEHARDFYRLCFPVLLQKIFGFEDCHSLPHPTSFALSAQSGGWLSLASSPYNEAAGKALISLLSPTGALFSSLLEVDKENSVRFVFPTERLPDWVRRLLNLEKGAFILSQVSKLFKDRIKVDANGSLQVQLDVFEYYVFWFAYYAVCKDISTQQGSSSSSKRERSASRSIQKRSLGHWVSGLHHSSQQGIGTYSHDPYLQLLHLYLIHFVSASSLTTSIGTSSMVQHVELPRTDLSRADFLVHTLVEFWLIDDDPLPLPLSVHQSLGLPALGSRGLAYVFPGSELTDALRLLVDYVNTVSTAPSMDLNSAGATFGRSGARFDVRSPSTFSSFSEGRDYQFNAYSKLLQRPLYRFILRAFHFWATGSPVKKASCIVDLWLDYLQPWTSSSGGRVEQEQLETRSAKGTVQSTRSSAYTERWQGFVVGNYIFYTTLVVHFLEFALKFIHVDLEAVLQMTAKILNLLAGSRDLLDCLRKVDATYHTSFPGRLQQSSELLSEIQEQLQDWEESGTVDCNQGNDLLHPSSLQSRTSQLRFFSMSENGGYQTLQMFILQAEQLASFATQSSITRALEAIKKAGQIIFDSRPLLSSAVTPHREAQQIAYPVVATRALPQHTWLDVKYRGDWMRRPIESTEVAWLVRFLVTLSDSINRKLDLMPLGEAREGKRQLRETDGVHTVMAEIPTDITEIGFTEILSRFRGIFSDFHLTEFLQIVISFMWSFWLFLLKSLRRQGWRVNLRFMAKKPIVIAVLLLVFYMFRKIFIRIAAYIFGYFFLLDCIC